MRLLWARVGVPYSPATGLPIAAQTVSQMVDRAMALPEGTRLYLLAPVVRGRKGEYRKELAEWQKAGFTRVRIDGALLRDRGRPGARQEVQARHRGGGRPAGRPPRHRDAAGGSARAGAQARRRPGLSRPGRRDASPHAGTVRGGERTVPERRRPRRRRASASPRRWRKRRARRPADNAPEGRIIFSEKFACPVSGFTIAEIEPRLFSFNAPQGACPACDGLGEKLLFDPELIVPNEALSHQEGRGRPLGALQPAQPLLHAGAGQPRRRVRLQPGDAVEGPARGDPRHHPQRHQGPPGHAALHRRPQELRGQEAVRRRDRQSQPPHAADRKRLDARGAQQISERRALRDLPRRPPPPRAARGEDRRRAYQPGHRPLGPPRARLVLDARRRSSPRPRTRSPARSSRRSTSGSASSTMSASTISTSTAPRARSRAARASASASPARSARASRACSTCSTSRRSASTSATTTGCSSRSSACAISATPCSSSSMTRTRSATPIMSSTWAPAPASMAARSSATARSTTCSRCETSLTADYLTGRRAVPIPAQRRKGTGRKLTLHGATANNLKSVTAAIPLGTFSCITGVSGSGKSSFTIDTLYAAAAAPLERRPHHRRPPRQAHRPRISRQGDRHRPVADRPHPALQPGHLYRRLHPDPRLVRRPAREPGARLQARPLQLQRQGRPLRGLRGRRPDQDRDALPPRRLRHLRRLPRPALQSRDARGEVQGPQHRRRARHDGRGRRRAVQGRPPDPRQDADAGGGRASATSRSASRRRR